MKLNKFRQKRINRAVQAKRLKHMLGVKEERNTSETQTQVPIRVHFVRG